MLKFDEGFRFDQQGNLRLEADQSELSPMPSCGHRGRRFSTDRSIYQSMVFKLSGSQILGLAALLYVEKTKDLVILSPFLAKRFQINSMNKFSLIHFSGVNPVRQPFMTQADWVSSLPNGVSLNMRGGYRVDANLQTFKGKSLELGSRSLCLSS